MKISYPFAAMARNGERLPAAAFTHKITIDGESLNVINYRHLMHEYKNGATIIAQAAESWLPEVAFVCNQLSNSVNAIFSANIYISPVSQPAFPPHYDTHDVFVLQLEGRKHWRLGKHAIKQPNRDQRYFCYEFEDFELYHSMILESGQGVYIPRGVVHEAAANTEASVHITIGMTPTTHWQLLSQLVHSKMDCALRSSIPLSRSVSIVEIANKFQAALRETEAGISNADLEDCFNAHQFTLVSKNMPVPWGLVDTVHGPITAYKLSPHLCSFRARRTDEGLIIAIGDEVISFSDVSHKALIEFLLDENVERTITPVNEEQTMALKHLESLGLVISVGYAK